MQCPAVATTSGATRNALHFPRNRLGPVGFVRAESRHTAVDDRVVESRVVEIEERGIRPVVD